ncbi:MAG: hypothetical protein WDZ41_01930 [Candidatus Babeliales bacterium]
MVDKRYFYINRFYNTVVAAPSDYMVRMELITLKIENVTVLTSDFSSEIVPTYQSGTNLDFAETLTTTDAAGNTTIDNVSASGLINSYNPLTQMMGLEFTDYTGVQRGSAVGTLTGSNYGILDNIGIGIDRAETWTDIGVQQGWSGNTPRCPFFMEIDFEKDFEMIIQVDHYVSGDTGTNNRRYHRYVLDSSKCSFLYESYKLEESEGLTGSVSKTDVQNHTNQAFLSKIPEQGHGEVTCLAPAGCTGTLTKRLGTIIKPFTPQLGDDRGFESCCFENYAFADSSSTEKRRNDFKSHLFKRVLPSDTMELTLEKDGGGSGNEFALDNNTYGELFDFGSITDRPDYFGYKLEWRKVLIAHGGGQYRIKLDYTTLGDTVTNYTSTFKLMEFDPILADKTARIDTVMNSYLKFNDMDYKDLNWENSIRFNGFFGRRRTTQENEELTYSGSDKVEGITSEQIQSYSCQVLLAPDCITNEIINYHLFADEMFAYDYNGNNHSYEDYNGLPIRLEEIEDPDQYATTRDETLNIRFTDRFRNRRKSNC